MRDARAVASAHSNARITTTLVQIMVVHRVYIVSPLPDYDFHSFGAN